MVERLDLPKKIEEKEIHSINIDQAQSICVLRNENLLGIRKCFSYVDKCVFNMLKKEMKY